MSNLLEELEIDVAAVKWDAESSVGVGEYYLAEAEKAANSEDGDVETKYLAAATAFRRAACHYLALDQPQKTGDLFSRAATAYYRGGNPYAYLLAALANGETRIPSPRSYFERLEGDADDNVSRLESSDADSFDPFPRRVTANSIFVALDLARQTDYRVERHRAERFEIPEMERFQTKRSRGLGTLGLPLDTYLNLAQFAVRIPPESNAMAEDDRFDSLYEEAPEVLAPLLTVYSDALSKAQQNRYHWRRLAMPFHPAEPDILGPLVMLREPLEMIGFELRSELERLPINGESRSVLSKLTDMFSGPSDFFQ
jgi:hypothetical protein